MELMKFYAHYGHEDFILCLGHNAHKIKEYFLNYDECYSNDFLLEGGNKPSLLKKDIEDWKILFADTGQNSNIGMRLQAVEKYLQDEDIFLANYADGLSDVPLDKMIEFFKNSGKTACFICVKPSQTFHYVRLDENGAVESIQDTTDTGLTVNGGFFIFSKKIFDYIRDGEELVHEPFARLIEKSELVAYQYDGYWRCMDTFKDKQEFDALVSEGTSPWEVWNKAVKN